MPRSLFPFTSPRGLIVAGATLSLGVLLSVGAGAGAQAATTLTGPIDLGTSAPFGVLAASTVTNTGPSVISGDVGLSPGTSVVGFPPAVIIGTGTLHKTDAVAKKAQADNTTAFTTAAGLTPTRSGLEQLDGLSLTPGVYSGGALDLSENGSLTLAGNAQSVWVFKAASTLTIGSGTNIILTGGASACNVFWEVGSSATLGTEAHFQGTILAKKSVTATTSATIVGRLLAQTGAVTLDTNTITVPTGCAAGSAPVTTPTITSGAPTGATAGTPYHFQVTSTGSPTPTYSVTSGTLPAGLTLGSTTGLLSGTPTASGTSTFTITASNGTATSASKTYSVTVRAAAASPAAQTLSTPAATEATGATSAQESLAFTGSRHTPEAGITALALLLIGTALLVVSRRRAARRNL